jgi:hypothetical protein
MAWIYRFGMTEMVFWFRMLTQVVRRKLNLESLDAIENETTTEQCRR